MRRGGQAIGSVTRGRRRGINFTMRITDEDRAALETLQREDEGPRALGPWLVWRALRDRAGTARARALPEQLGHCRTWNGTALPARQCPHEQAMPAPAAALPGPGNAPRRILDLCAGSGSWSEPYVRAGYEVIRVTLPDADVRTYVPPSDVWGVLAAPPCTEFSLAKNGHTTERDWVEAMACVNACMRIVLQVRPKWWALENPTGYLGRFLGPARDTWQPCDFGDPWTKRTAIWGDFTIPERGPFVVPVGSAMDRPTADDRALTPPGFAWAFFEANP